MHDLSPIARVLETRFAWEEAVRSAWRESGSVFAEHQRRCGGCAPGWLDGLPADAVDCAGGVEDVNQADFDFDGLPDVCDYDDDNDNDYDRTDPQPYDAGVYYYAPGGSPWGGPGRAAVGVYDVFVVGRTLDVYA